MYGNSVTKQSKENMFKIRTLIPIHGHTNAVHISTPYSFKNLLSNFVPSTTRSVT
jgi:hypothetical protein